jgi:hypothetical protein
MWGRVWVEGRWEEEQCSAKAKESHCLTTHIRQ